MSNIRESVGDDRQKPHSHFVSSWAGFVLLGLFVYELTSQASLGLATVSIKVAWRDMQTACWLRKRDVHKSRGRTCFWGYLGSGSLKAGALAIVLALTLVPFFERGFKAPGNIPAYFIEAATTIVVALVLASMCTFWASIIALRSGVRVWVGNEASLARRLRIWPPQNGKNIPTENVMFRGLVCVTWAVMLLGFEALFLVLQRNYPEQGLLWTIFVLLLPCGIGSLFLYQVERKAVASKPSECWDEGAVGGETTDYRPRTTDQ